MNEHKIYTNKEINSHFGINIYFLIKKNYFDIEYNIKNDIKITCNSLNVIDECIICYECKPLCSKFSCKHNFCMSCLDRIAICAYCRSI